MEPITIKCPKCGSGLFKQRKVEREGYEYQSYTCSKCAFEFVEKVEVEKLVSSYRDKIKGISTGFVTKPFNVPKT